MAKRAATDLIEAESGEIFLEHKRKKKRIDEKNTSHSCFTVNARSLSITWVHREYWTWKCVKETSNENIEVAKLSHVCWLDVRGRLDMSELSPEVVYEIVYVVKLTEGASGWELPIQLILSLPDGTVQTHQVLYFVLEVNGTSFHHHFLFLIMSETYDGLMMDFEVFYHSHLILPSEGLQLHQINLKIRTRLQMNNTFGIFRLALSSLSCSLIDLPQHTEVTCQRGR